MILVVRVKLVTEEDRGRSLPGVRLALYDRDKTDEDDFLAEGVTGENGEAKLVFDSDQYTDQEDQPAWRLDSMPDLFVKVYNHEGQEIYSTRDQAAQDKLPDQIIVELPKELVERQRLMPL
jgi:hypothetical protein